MKYNKFEACFDAKCQALNVNYRAFSVDYDVQCIDVTKSFSGDKKGRLWRIAAFFFFSFLFLFFSF